MDKTTLENMLTTHSANLKAKREELFKAAGLTIAAKQELEDSKLTLILSGKIDGKNAEIRDAQMAEQLAKHIQNLRLAEDIERRARHAYDQAVTDMDMTRYMIRIQEVFHE